MSDSENRQEWLEGFSPAAIEHDGKLYIVYTVDYPGHRACEQAIMPLSSLVATEPDPSSIPLHNSSGGLSMRREQERC
jgi:hypothetical protein